MNDLPLNLVLTGFMGTGKTTAGHFVTHRLGLPFYDTDHLITTRAGMSIPQIFAQYGEAEFRRIEREICEEIAARRGQIVATGGGMLITEDNLAAMMQNSVVICLWASEDTLRDRLTADPSRPLAADWEAVLARRKEIYAAMPHHIVTTDKTPEQVAEEAIEIWRKHSG